MHGADVDERRVISMSEVHSTLLYSTLLTNIGRTSKGVENIR